MFGHCLRLNLETYYFQEEPQLKKFDGRTRTTLPVVLNNDLSLTKKTFPEIKLTKLKTSSDLQKAREKLMGKRIYPKTKS